MSEVSNLSNFELKHILGKKTGCKLKRYRTNKQANKQTKRSGWGATTA